MLVKAMALDTAQLEALHIVRKIREKIRKWWSIELAPADSTGFVVDHGKGVVVPPHNRICQSCLSGKEGFLRCNRSIEKAIVELAGQDDNRARLMGQCHMGIDIIAAPIRIDGEYQGSMFACGFLLSDEVEERRTEVLHNARKMSLPLVDADRAFDGIATIGRRDLDYFTDLLETTAEEIVEFQRTMTQKEQRIAELSRQLGGRYGFANIIGKSAAMQRLYSLLEKLVESHSTVLVTGENGTGKELIARALHYNGPRKARAFVAQNMSALNDNLLESELFGHVKGSFTGATRDKAGLFKTADGGTFFLDEIGDCSMAMQVKLLRVLQEGTFLPVGATRAEKVDVRIVAATNRDLKTMVQRKEFREDLYYRLNVLNIEVPPLRQRLDDLPLLVDHFLKHNAERTGRPLKRLSPELMASLYESHWPGNIRELENEMERLVVLSGDKELIGPELRSAGGRATALEDRTLARFREKGDLASAVSALERDMIERGLVATSWNKTKLAERLGVSRTTLIKKIKEFGIEDRGLGAEE